MTEKNFFNKLLDNLFPILLVAMILFGAIALLEGFMQDSVVKKKFDEGKEIVCRTRFRGIEYIYFVSKSNGWKKTDYGYKKRVNDYSAIVVNYDDCYFSEQ